MNDFIGEFEKIVHEKNARIEALEAAQKEALDYATSLLAIFVNEHCSPVSGWKPQPELIGVLTQLDNAITIARDYKARIEALEAALRLIEPLVIDNRKALIIIRGALDKDAGQ